MVCGSRCLQFVGHRQVGNSFCFFCARETGVRVLCVAWSQLLGCFGCQVSRGLSVETRDALHPLTLASISFQVVTFFRLPVLLQALSFAKWRANDAACCSSAPR